MAQPPSPILGTDVERVLKGVSLDALDGKSVLVTGASGLLGTNILAVLQAAVSRGLDLRIHAQVRTGLHEIPLGEKTTLHYANLASSEDCARLPQVDVVISAASYAQPLRFMSEPLSALRSSAFGLMALLEKVRVGGRFLYISSSEVYLDCESEPPFHEDDIGKISPYHPRACYVIGKIFGEAIVNLYRNRGIETVSVRPGITYGPGFKWGDRRSWVEFIERGLRDHQLTLRDPGRVCRTFCYVADGMELLFGALLRGRDPVYNMSGPTAYSIAELAQTIGGILQIPVTIPEIDQGVAGTPEDLRMSSRRLYQLLGRSLDSFVPFREGLERTIAWAKSRWISA